MHLFHTCFNSSFLTNILYLNILQWCEVQTNTEEEIKDHIKVNHMVMVKIVINILCRLPMTQEAPHFS